MSVSFIVYETASGRLLRCGSYAGTGDEDVAAILAAQTAAGESAILGPFTLGADFYVVAGALRARPDCPVFASSEGTRSVSLIGVPLDATISVTGDATMQFANDDPSGELSLAFGVSGTYRVTVDCFPARDFDQTFVLP